MTYQTGILTDIQDDDPEFDDKGKAMVAAELLAIQLDKEAANESSGGFAGLWTGQRDGSRLLEICHCVGGEVTWYERAGK